MRRQLQGIALILAGIVLALSSLSERELPGVFGEVMVLFPLLAIAVSIAGLVLVFLNGKD